MHGLRTDQKWKSKITKDFRHNFSEYCTTQFQEQLELSANYTLEATTATEQWTVKHSQSQKSRDLVLAQGKWTCNCNYAVCHMLPCRHILCKLAGGSPPQQSSLELAHVAPYVNVHWQIETELLKDETIGEAGSGEQQSSSAPAPCTDDVVRVEDGNTDEGSSVADTNSPVQPPHVTDQATAAAAKTRRENDNTRFTDMCELAKQISNLTSPHPEMWSRSMTVLRLLLERLNGQDQNGSQVESFDSLCSLVRTQIPRVPVQAPTHHRTATTPSPSLDPDLAKVGRSAPRAPALALHRTKKPQESLLPPPRGRQKERNTSAASARRQTTL